MVVVIMPLFVTYEITPANSGQQIKKTVVTEATYLTNICIHLRPHVCRLSLCRVA